MQSDRTRQISYEAAMNLARAATLIALLVTAGAAAILLLSDSPGSCPGWHLRDAEHTSIWFSMAFWTVPLIAILCFTVVRWNWALQKTAERSGSSVSGKLPASDVLVPAEYALTQTCLSIAALSQLPLLFIVDCAIG
jgi:hypothetical protein